MDHIDVCSYHYSIPPAGPLESSYSSKSTASLTPTRQRLIDSAVGKKNQAKSEHRAYSWTDSEKVNSRFVVPNLYANQRVRQRSSSRDPPLLLQRDLKKTVAFGRTTTIGEHRNLMRPSTSNSQSSTKLHNEIRYLQSRVDVNEKLQTDVDQLQKVVKSLIEENLDLHTCFHDNRSLHEDIKQLNKTVQELVEDNTTLRTRINLMEVRYARWNAVEESTSQSIRKSHSNSQPKKMDNETVNKNKQEYRYDWRTRRRIAQIYIGDKHNELDEESSRLESNNN